MHGLMRKTLGYSALQQPAAAAPASDRAPAAGVARSIPQRDRSNSGDGQNRRQQNRTTKPSNRAAITMDSLAMLGCEETSSVSDVQRAGEASKKPAKIINHQQPSKKRVTMKNIVEPAAQTSVLMNLDANALPSAPPPPRVAKQHHLNRKAAGKKVAVAKKKASSSSSLSSLRGKRKGGRKQKHPSSGASSYNLRDRNNGKAGTTKKKKGRNRISSVMSSAMGGVLTSLERITLEDDDDDDDDEDDVRDEYGENEPPVNKKTRAAKKTALRSMKSKAPPTAAAAATFFGGGEVMMSLAEASAPVADDDKINNSNYNNDKKANKGKERGSKKGPVGKYHPVVETRKKKAAAFGNGTSTVGIAPSMNYRSGGASNSNYRYASGGCEGGLGSFFGLSEEYGGDIWVRGGGAGGGDDDDDDDTFEAPPHIAIHRPCWATKLGVGVSSLSDSASLGNTASFDSFGQLPGVNQELLPPYQNCRSKAPRNPSRRNGTDSSSCNITGLMAFLHQQTSGAAASGCNGNNVNNEPTKGDKRRLIKVQRPSARKNRGGRRPQQRMAEKDGNKSIVDCDEDDDERNGVASRRRSCIKRAGSALICSPSPNRAGVVEDHRRFNYSSCEEEEDDDDDDELWDRQRGCTSGRRSLEGNCSPLPIYSTNPIKRLNAQPTPTKDGFACCTPKNLLFSRCKSSKVNTPDGRGDAMELDLSSIENGETHLEQLNVSGFDANLGTTGGDNESVCDNISDSDHYLDQLQVSGFDAKNDGPAEMIQYDFAPLEARVTGPQESQEHLQAQKDATSVRYDQVEVGKPIMMMKALHSQSPTTIVSKQHRSAASSSSDKKPSYVMVPKVARLGGCSDADGISDLDDSPASANVKEAHPKQQNEAPGDSINNEPPRKIELLQDKTTSAPLNTIATESPCVGVESCTSTGKGEKRRSSPSEESTVSVPSTKASSDDECSHEGATDMSGGLRRSRRARAPPDRFKPPNQPKSNREVSQRRVDGSAAVQDGKKKTAATCSDGFGSKRPPTCPSVIQDSVRRSSRSSREPDRYAGGSDRNEKSKGAQNRDNRAAKQQNRKRPGSKPRFDQAEASPGADSIPTPLFQPARRSKKTPSDSDDDEQSEVIETSGGESDHRPQRSHRRRKEPDRFGYYGDMEDVGSTASSRKIAVPKGNRAAKGECRSVLKKMPSSEPQNALNDVSEDGWTRNQMLQLKDAHKLVDPTSMAFWNLVAARVEGMSATECRDKWFSLVATPMLKAGSKKSNAMAMENQTSDDGDEDDLFNATPFRAERKPEGQSNYDLGSAIRVQMNQNNCDAFDDDDSFFGGNAGGAKLRTNVAYPKTYLNALKPKKNKKGVGSQKPPGLPLKSNKVVTEAFHDGDADLNARLSPGGTLHLKDLGGGGFDDEDCFEEMYDLDGDPELSEI